MWHGNKGRSLRTIQVMGPVYELLVVVVDDRSGQDTGGTVADAARSAGVGPEQAGRQRMLVATSLPRVAHLHVRLNDLCEWPQA